MPQNSNCGSAQRFSDPFSKIFFKISISAADGTVVPTLDLGHQAAERHSRNLSKVEGEAVLNHSDENNIRHYAMALSITTVNLTDARHLKIYTFEFDLVLS